MKKIVKYVLALFIIFLIGFLGFVTNKVLNIYYNIELIDVDLINYDEKNNLINILITRKNNTLNKEFSCHAEGSFDTFSANGSNNKCTLTLRMNDSYELYLKNNNGNKSKIYKLSNVLDNVLSFNFSVDTMYLTTEEEGKIAYYDILINDKEEDYKFTSSDESIIQIEGNIVKALKPGEATITSPKTNKTLKVIVTDLISNPYVSLEKKEIVPCNVYTEDEATMLDKILAYKINVAGYKTRAGAVAAARFLTLEFKYRIPYFYENGRVHESGVHFADGEGRYYKTGLYLSDSKKNDIIASWRGPAIWGCPLTNLESRPEYGYIMGAKKPNGLDCSGFVSWALKNAGFNPGDVGAGETPYPYQMTDLGEFVHLTEDLIKSNKIKAGDLINWWGHIGIIIGIDEENFYIAESLPYLGGVVAKIYPKKTIMNTFEYVVLMDEYYIDEGNYTAYWE